VQVGVQVEKSGSLFSQETNLEKPNLRQPMPAQAATAASAAKPGSNSSFFDPVGYGGASMICLFIVAGGVVVARKEQEKRSDRRRRALMSASTLSPSSNGNAANTASPPWGWQQGRPAVASSEGFLMQAELDAFSTVLDKSNKPVLAILGGAKVSDKAQLINSLLDKKKVDKIIIGGGMAFTFLKVINKMEIGKSLYDEEGATMVNAIMKKAKASNVEIVLPVDFMCCELFGEGGAIQHSTLETGVPAGFMGLDCGPATIALNSEAVKASKTILWNGPMGVFEMASFEKGTKALVDDIVAATGNGAFTVIGGGDTATAAKKYGAETKALISQGSFKVQTTAPSMSFKWDMPKFAAVATSMAPAAAFATEGTNEILGIDTNLIPLLGLPTLLVANIAFNNWAQTQDNDDFFDELPPPPRSR